METHAALRSHPESMLSIVRRQGLKSLLAFIAVLGLTVAYFAIATRTFRSEAKIFVRMGRESVVLDPTATSAHMIAPADSRDSEVNAVQELLISRTLAEKIVDQFGADVIREKDLEKKGPSLGERMAWLEPYNLNPLRVYSARDKAIVHFQKSLEAETVKRTSIVVVSYESGDAQLAHDILTFLVQAAREEHLSVHRTKGSQQFFVDQAELLRANVNRLEEQLRSLKDKTGLASLVTQREIQLQQIGSLQGDLVRARAEHDAASAEVVRRKQQFQNSPAMIVSEQVSGQPQTSRQALREKLYDLEMKEQELEVKLTAEAPLLAHIRKQAAEARRIAGEELATTQTTKGMNPARQAAELALQEREAQLASLAGRTGSLESKIAQGQEALKEINASEVSLGQLEREIDLARANYRKYAENLEQARIDQQLEQAKISSLNLLQAPSLSITPVSPKPSTTLALGFVAAVFSAIGVALLGERSRTPSAVGSLPHISIPHETPPLYPERWRPSEAAPANPR